MLNFARKLYVLVLLLPCIASAQLPPNGYHASIVAREWSSAALNDQSQVASVPWSGTPQLWNGVTGSTRLPGAVYHALIEGINNNGTVVGSAWLMDDPDVSESGILYKPVVWRPGGSVTRVVPGAVSGSAYGINNQGSIVGVADGEGFLLREQGMLEFDGFYPVAINDSETVLGYDAHGMATWRDGVLTAVADTGYGTPVAINNHGDIVGSKFFEAGLWRAGQFTALWYGQAADINDAGMVVGTSQDERAMAWIDGKVYLLDHLWTDPKWSSWTLTSALAVNEAGEILALARNLQQGEQYIVLLSAVPEPASIWLLLAASMLLLLRAENPLRTPDARACNGS